MQKINVEIDNKSEAFFADFIAVNHVRNQFALDFRQTTPRVNPSPDKRNVQSLFIRHNAVVISPVLVKEFMNILKKNIEEYERKFGKIQIPKPKENTREDSEQSADTSYVG